MMRLIFTACFIIPTLLKAQSEVSWSDIIGNDPTDKETVVLGLSQVTFSNVPISQNGFSIFQIGNSNTVSINALGQGIGVSVLQEGNANITDLTLSGTNGNVGLLQLGNNNTIQMSSEISQANLEVVQMGDNNGLVSGGSVPSTIMPIRIEQSGGMQVSIVHNY
ncbi:MAG: hypothetical protein ACK4GN_07440 [Runella sp.]